MNVVDVKLASRVVKRRRDLVQVFLQCVSGDGYRGVLIKP